MRQRASTARCVNLLFQFTHHTGCDVLGRSLHCNHVGFNPRTQGATAQSYPENTDFRSFNPRTHTGCDPETWTANILKSCFNPRTHTGCDSKISFCLSTELSFNPRTHTGCDVGLLVSVWRGGGFNPRTHTGCDAYRCSPTSACSCFNPRTHTGCDAGNADEAIASDVSIHAPTRGATVAHLSILSNH